MRRAVTADGRRSGRGALLGVCGVKPGAKGGGEVFGAGQLDEQLLDLAAGVLFVGPHPLQDCIPLGVVSRLGMVEAVGGVEEVTHCSR